MIPGICDTTATTSPTTATASSASANITAKSSSIKMINYRNTNKALQQSQNTIDLKQRIYCSQQSLLISIERFVQSMNNLDSTILIPSKLRDMDTIGLKTVQRLIPDTFSAAAAAAATNQQTNELYNFFLMLNDIKKELFWGTSSAASAVSAASASTNTSTACSVMTPQSSLTSHEQYIYQQQPNDNERRNSIINNTSSLKQSQLPSHLRQLSHEDSTNSSGISSSLSDTDSDADSMMTDSIDCNNNSSNDSISHLFLTFRHHLQGLNSILSQLTDSANYLSVRYQEEIED